MNLYHKKIIITGLCFFVLVLIAGIFLSWLVISNARLSPIKESFLIRSTILPLFIMAGFALVTIPVFLISSGLIFLAFLKSKIWWLSIFGFVIAGIYWLIMVWASSLMPLD